MWGSLRLAPIIVMHVCVKLVYMCTQLYYSYSIFVQVPVQWVHICVVHVHLSVNAWHFYFHPDTDGQILHALC